MFLKILQNLITSLSMMLFFLVYRSYGIIIASAALFVLQVFIFGFNYFIVNDKISLSFCVSTIVVVLFAFLSVVTGEKSYLQIHVSIVNVFFAILLLFGAAIKKDFLKTIIGNSVKNSNIDVVSLSIKWALFFFLIALCNEIIRKFCSEYVWVLFVVFGVGIITSTFVAIQIKPRKNNNNKFYVQ